MHRFIGVLVFSFFMASAFAQVRKPVIAFASDTQEPMWVEKLLLKSNHNLKATEMIFKDVDAVRPSGLFILGDVVSLGYKAKKWTHIDAYIKQCTHDSIPVYATLGNHEVMFNARKGTRNFKTRFPMYNPAGYTEIIDSVAVVLLNSNFSKMTTAEILAQDNWYSSAIKKLDADAAIKFIIVGCHHSPYTNSKIVKPSMEVRQNFLPAFINSKKCVLFVSGHSHNFERFNMQGKDFLVIGGGGGLHQPLYANAVTPDLSAGYKPMFHYLEVRRVHDSLQLVSRELNADFSGFKDGLVFTVR
ncbi:metallophosphoesterase family protein [Mucilaginibacter sp. OK098]|uniref:metallophosphoesterase family protein n=1 Tax=Mucilaginibacter sp. OK098 TaxID=1855297 RepID=UPI00091E5CDC|nr:metallophosphoesterase [Mucilaginibacter sp. OK098]SHM40701.1 Calcineurin-like phosphoesterase [Mucilaginibacter sp. OK098]